MNQAIIPFAGPRELATVHVDVRGIVEALDRVYKAAGLLKELGAGQEAPARSRPSGAIGLVRNLTNRRSSPGPIYHPPREFDY